MPTATDTPDPAFGHSTRKQRIWRVGLIVVAVILIVAAVLIWRHHEATEAAAAAARRAAAAGITVTTATAKTGDISVYLDAIGTVTPVYTNSITSVKVIRL
jgi:membrane fusion protein, multidrug efflux system